MYSGPLSSSSDVSESDKCQSEFFTCIETRKRTVCMYVYLISEERRFVFCLIFKQSDCRCGRSPRHHLVGGTKDVFG